MGEKPKDTSSLWLDNYLTARYGFRTRRIANVYRGPYGVYGLLRVQMHMHPCPAVTKSLFPPLCRITLSNLTGASGTDSRLRFTCGKKFPVTNHRSHFVIRISFGLWHSDSCPCPCTPRTPW